MEKQSILIQDLQVLKKVLLKKQFFDKFSSGGGVSEKHLKGARESRLVCQILKFFRAPKIFPICLNTNKKDWQFSTFYLLVSLNQLRYSFEVECITYSGYVLGLSEVKVGRKKDPQLSILNLAYSPRVGNSIWYVFAAETATEFGSC